ncbi:MAG: HD domain-containing protein [Candidatus Gastranaerophilales bacterium]|nr:HD domain-containing protein [Candidatus Gastranaerophilales bacterium]
MAFKTALKKFTEEAIFEGHPKWEICIKRPAKLSKKEFDIRSEFERDNNRIMHSTAYRRLKDKTQVFFATNKDVICTRIEHVNHVASISRAICKTMGLNSDLAEAAALGHDLGHTPFGHQGERIIEELVLKHGLAKSFWHEKNSLRFIDLIETLPNYMGKQDNLNLTYAVRDAIISHCGEVDENYLKPRSEVIQLDSMEKGIYAPFTYEGCVVKVSDKIAYLGRDIEDAFTYGILGPKQARELKQIAENLLKKKFPLGEVNTTVLMYEFIQDLCWNSTPQDGLSFTKERFEMMNQIKEFNYIHICEHKRLQPFKAYSKLILNTIFDFLLSYYKREETIKAMQKDYQYFPVVMKEFEDWLIKYSDIDLKKKQYRKCCNETIYQIINEKDYKQAIIDFLSSLTDHFAIEIFEEIITF